jgi:hypothetical protein
MRFLGEKTKKKMSGWIGNSMSIGGRLVKIDACLSSTAVYQMSLRLLHKTNIEQMDKPIRSFFWAGSAERRKYHFVKWKWICKPKQKGGLGIKNLLKFNISLMCKWWWKLEHGNGPWQDFMRKKYLKDKGIYYTQKRPGDSALWADMMTVRDIYLCGRRMRVGNGLLTSFWGDSWCSISPLKDMFPVLFDICNDQKISVAEAAVLGWRFTYRRWLTPDLIIQEAGILQILNHVRLSEEKDSPHWKWSKNGIFTVKSMYKHLCSNGRDRSFRHLWKSKIPLKIKVWLWMIWHNAIATKDNLIIRNWSGNSTCQFCSDQETISHLFFGCSAAKFVWSAVATAINAHTRPGSFSQFFWWFPQFVPASRNTQIAGFAAICWAIWKIRNKACFENKLISSPLDLISYAVVFMNYWAGLHGEKDAEDIRAGADGLMHLVAAGAGTSTSGNGGRAGLLRLNDKTPDDADDKNVS